MKKTHRILVAGAVALVAVLGAAPSASAQEDARWLPWLGCWESVDQYADEGMICVRPASSGVEMLTLAEGEVVSREVLTADGRPSSVESEGCTGSRTARFSEDGRRLFTTSQLTCEGEFERGGQGLMAMTSPASWIDVQVVDAGGREMAWVQHYRPAAEEAVEAAGMAGIEAGRAMALRTARHSAATAVELADVVEANREVGGEAVKAWISETRDPFDLDGRTLLELADSGVDPEVIDVLVAVSYPEHFVVDAEGAQAERMADEEYDRYARRGPMGGWSYWNSPFYYGSFYSPYRYGYGGFGYGYYGYGYRPTVIVVAPSGSDDGGRGRFVKGRGYVRTGSGSDAPAVRGSSGSSSGAAARGATRRSGGSSAGAASSSTGSSSSSGRSAKRRGGGGGGGSDDGGGFFF